MVGFIDDILNWLWDDFLGFGSPEQMFQFFTWVNSFIIMIIVLIRSKKSQREV